MFAEALGWGVCVCFLRGVSSSEDVYIEDPRLNFPLWDLDVTFTVVVGLSKGESRFCCVGGTELW